MFSRLKTIPLSAVFITLSGIILGLLVGLLISIPLDKLPYDWAWMISVAVYFLSALLMAVLFTLRQQQILDVLQKSWFKRFLNPEEGSETGTLSLGSQDKSSKREEKWEQILLLDTSAIIDGRIADIIAVGFLEGKIVVPSFILEELQQIADSSQVVRRRRGRRGLEILEELKKEKFLPFEVLDYRLPRNTSVDSALIELAVNKGAKIVTTDFNLNKVGKLRGVKILNINELANMVKTIVIPGEELTVEVIQKGKETGQGVGYLPDGTMIIVEEGESLLGQNVRVVVERLFQTEAGRMIFVRPLSKK